MARGDFSRARDGAVICVRAFRRGRKKATSGGGKWDIFKVAAVSSSRRATRACTRRVRRAEGATSAVDCAAAAVAESRSGEKVSIILTRLRLLIAVLIAVTLLRDSRCAFYLDALV